MKTVCELNKCAGCMACLESCTKNAIHVEKRLDAYNAVIDTSRCINCGACHRICHVNYPADFRKPVRWWQGWTKSKTILERSSSGGAASAIESAFLHSGGVVCSCQFTKGEFGFSFADTEEALKNFCGSKYVKSNPKGIYRELKTRLKSGQKVLFVGLPCQVSAVRNFVGKTLEENLFTADLICHGSPNPEVLEIFLKQYGMSLKNLDTIQFRSKTSFQLKENEKPIGTLGTLDRYTLAFLNGISYTENCYSCSYARRERVSDITLGDSWGTELDIKSGVSLILCQTEKGVHLVEQAELELKGVDIDNAIANNKQLQYPSKLPTDRKEFFDEISEKKFNDVVKKHFPMQCRKQQLKGILLKLGILNRGGITHK